MATPPDVNPSLLEYARHFGIAKDPSTSTPESYLIESGIDDLFPLTTPRNINSLRARYEELESLVGHHFEHEKLDISIQEGRLLASVQKLDQDEPLPDTHAMLPPLRRVSSLRGEPMLETLKEGKQRGQDLEHSDTAEPLYDNTSPFPFKDETAFIELKKSDIDIVEEKPSPSEESSTMLPKFQPDESFSEKEVTSFVDAVISIGKGNPMLPDNKLPQSQPEADRSRSTVFSTLMRPLLLSTDLGSLSSFMETRGVTVDPCTSPLFDPYPRPNPPETTFFPAVPDTDTAIVLDLTAPPATSQGHAQDMDDVTLYLSSDLLKSHLPLIQALETMSQPPQLVYRDYDAQERVEDADIIIPPTTAIVLTNAQALTQQLLPGYDEPYASPVLNRVNRLAPRYKSFYVLVASNRTVDKPTANAIASLKSFCESVSDDVTVVPLIVSSEKVVEWVLALALRKAESEL